MSWPIVTTVLLVSVLAVMTVWYERTRPSSKVVVMVATLAALAVAGRVLFVAVPNVQATTDVVFFAGYAAGGPIGIMVGSTAALASNVFLGQGPWTPWQMVGWAAVGGSGALVARLLGRRIGRLPSALLCAGAGLLFGAWMDLFTLVSFSAAKTAEAYVAISATSLPFNVAHAVGNAVLALLLGPAFIRTLRRYQERCTVEWNGDAAPPGRVDPDAPVRAGTVRVPLALFLLSLTAAVSTLAVSVEKAHASPSDGVRYLMNAQNADGGFGGAPGQASSQMMTGWAALGIAAAGRNPLEAKRNGLSPIDYAKSHGKLDDIGSVERTILVLRAAGLNPRSFAGRNLIAELLALRRGNGSFGGTTNHTAFGIMALRASGFSTAGRTIRQAGRRLLRAQNSDGGFGFGDRGGASDVDDTGAVLQGMRSAGMSSHRAVGKALAYLRRAQRPDGGFGQSRGADSNAQSTSWAVQGIVAAGRHPKDFRKHGRSPFDYLGSLQTANGSYRYSRTSAQTPVWVTAQAVAAVNLQPFPLSPRRGVTRLRSDSSHPPGARPRAAKRPNARTGARSRGKAHVAPTVHLPAPGPSSSRTTSARSVAPIPARSKPESSRPNPGRTWLVALAVTTGLMIPALGGIRMLKRPERSGGSNDPLTDERE